MILLFFKNCEKYTKIIEKTVQYIENDNKYINDIDKIGKKF